jgi:hypothetical protein
MVFNGEMLSHLDAAPRGGESEVVWPGVKAEAVRDGVASLGTGERHGGGSSQRRWRCYQLEVEGGDTVMGLLVG